MILVDGEGVCDIPRAWRVERHRWASCEVEMGRLL